MLYGARPQTDILAARWNAQLVICVQTASNSVWRQYLECSTGHDGAQLSPDAVELVNAFGAYMIAADGVRHTNRDSASGFVTIVIYLSLLSAGLCH